jgi:hypothetical protein
MGGGGGNDVYIVDNIGDVVVGGVAQVAFATLATGLALTSADFVVV